MKLQYELEGIIEAAAKGLGAEITEPGTIERPRDKAHGDYASGLAMRIANKLGKKPIELAEAIAEAARSAQGVASVEVAPPGFVNIDLAPEARCAIVTETLRHGARFGSSPPSGGAMLIEFVSANPTGPLHVGHGRSAAVGDSLARILRFAGTEVKTEYYLNDRGLQTDILAASLWLRVLMEKGMLEGEMPNGTYKGDYLASAARSFISANPEVSGAPLDLGSLPDKPEEAASEVAAKAKEALGKDFEAVRSFTIDSMVRTIRDELAGFGVIHDTWISERALFDDGMMKEAIDELGRLGHTYKKDGALWFRSSDLGDEKDWVVVRSNGEMTYFAADVAYHVEKARRGPGIVYDLLGADHHGYVPRLRALLAAFGEDPDRLEVGMVQFVSLSNAEGRVKMSTRSGKFMPLAELVESVGASAARLFFVMSRADVPMDFDVSKAATAGNENPVHYMQYAHARSCTLLERWGGDVGDLGTVDPKHLEEDEAKAVMTELRWLGATVRTAARERSPHRIAHWLIALASALHGFYDRVPVLSGEAAALASRLALVAATRQALANGMGLVGVEAPNKM